MKKITLLTGLLLIFVSHFTFGQKFGYVDTEYVLSRMQEYKEAQTEIQKLAQGWEDEIQQMLMDVEEKEAILQAEEVLLTQELKNERRMEIDRNWKEVKDYQKQVFGFDGLYFLKKKELMKPVQDLVFEAVERVSKNNRIQIMFDKSGDLVMIYTDPIHDYTDYVLEELGLGENNTEQSIKG